MPAHFHVKIDFCLPLPSLFSLVRSSTAALCRLHCCNMFPTVLLHLPDVLFGSILEFLPLNSRLALRTGSPESCNIFDRVHRAESRLAVDLKWPECYNDDRKRLDNSVEVSQNSFVVGSCGSEKAFRTPQHLASV
eukprot:GABV01004538.1.p2 GENE.GABV01004538.1~~GABV01004538.1.p2  ORF type:complete len:149 (+),score=29.87 GABV01004538.1:43-447(+)